jgi:hypothetical protein
MKKVTGIGDIFFKCKGPEKIKAWYRHHLRIDAGGDKTCIKLYALRVKPFNVFHFENIFLISPSCSMDHGPSQLSQAADR